MTDITKQLADALRRCLSLLEGGHYEDSEIYRKGVEVSATYKAQAAEPKQEPVAWAQLTANGQIAHFDGKPMVMVGPVGNECHPTPLVAAPVAQAEPRKPLTHKQVMACATRAGWPPSMISGFAQAKLEVFAREIEADHGIKENP